MERMAKLHELLAVESQSLIHQVSVSDEKWDKLVKPKTGKKWSQSLIHQVSVSDNRNQNKEADYESLNPLFIRSQFQIISFCVPFAIHYEESLNPLFIRSQFQI